MRQWNLLLRILGSHAFASLPIFGGRVVGVDGEFRQHETGQSGLAPESVVVGFFCVLFPTL